jgi:hypothetical protein
MFLTILGPQALVDQIIPEVENLPTSEVLNRELAYRGQDAMLNPLPVRAVRPHRRPGMTPLPSLKVAVDR